MWKCYQFGFRGWFWIIIYPGFAHICYTQTQVHKYFILPPSSSNDIQDNFLENYTFELQDKCYSWNVCANAFLFPKWFKGYFEFVHIYVCIYAKKCDSRILCTFFLLHIYEKTPDATDTILSFYARPLKIQDVFRLVQ